MKKTLVILVFLSFLESCQTPPQVFEGRQCQAVFAFDSNNDIDPGQSFCRCRSYHIGKDFIGSRGNVSRYPLRECDQYLGYSVRENTRLVNFMEYVRSEINAAKAELEKGLPREAEESIRTGEAGWQDLAGETNSGDHQEARNE